MQQRTLVLDNKQLPTKESIQQVVRRLYHPPDNNAQEGAISPDVLPPGSGENNQLTAREEKYLADLRNKTVTALHSDSNVTEDGFLEVVDQFYSVRKKKRNQGNR